MLRVTIADDHALIREGLRKVFARAGDIDVVGEAASHAELLELIERLSPDVVVMDAGMPGGGAVESLQSIARRRPKLPVLILSMLPEDQVAPRLLKFGAAGFVSKGAPSEELLAAVRRVALGERYLSESLRERLAPGRPKPRERLSKRETEILRFIACGRAVKEIAARLGITVSTVHTHRTRMLEKLDARTDAELVRYAIEHHLD